MMWAHHDSKNEKSYSFSMWLEKHCSCSLDIPLEQCSEPTARQSEEEPGLDEQG